MDDKHETLRALSYCQARDHVLRLLDVAELEKHIERFGLPRPERWAHPTVPMAMMHKARLNIRAFTKEEKLVSARWLLANGYKLPENIELRGDELIGAEYQQ